MAPSSTNNTKPTVLAFHGSGSNATVHTVQLARLSRVIAPSFKVESLEGPFDSAAGPGVLPFFDGCGPFKGWLPLGRKVTLDPSESVTLPSDLPAEVEDAVRTAVQRIRSEGGRVVGLVGFSQGTRVVAGLLKGTEIRRALGAQAAGGAETDWLDFDFGVSVCASYPPPLLPPSLVKQLQASGLSQEEQERLVQAKIELPAFFAQGKKDKWNDVGHAMIQRHVVVEEGKGVVREWENDHHYPVNPEESAEIGRWMVDVLKGVDAKET